MAETAKKPVAKKDNVILSDAKNLGKNGDSSAKVRNDQDNNVAKTTEPVILSEASAKSKDLDKKVPQQVRNDKSAKYLPRLKKLYKENYAPELQKELGIKNIHDVPKLEKIIVASGTGKGKDDKKYQEIVEITLRKITGQQPIKRIAKKSIASFKIRKGMGAPLGQMVTLRGDMMYEFLDRLVNVAMPRIRDFHGAKQSGFDRQGNYTLGIVEQSIFPELSFEDTAILHGLQVTFVISNSNKKTERSDVPHKTGGLVSGAPSRALLEKFGIPFEKGAK